MIFVITVLRVALGIIALRGARWAYAGFIMLGLMYFPMKVGFELSPRACQLAFDLELAAMSMRNWGHVILFTIFFIMTAAQFSELTPRTFVWAAGATIVMGALVEIAQALSGEGNCRARDLIPDTMGAIIGTGVVLLFRQLGWKPRPTWKLPSWRS